MKEAKTGEAGVGRGKDSECETSRRFRGSRCEDKDAALRACSNGLVGRVVPSLRYLLGFDAIALRDRTADARFL
jgi:hypothetical protein